MKEITFFFINKHYEMYYVLKKIKIVNLEFCVEKLQDEIIK